MSIEDARAAEAAEPTPPPNFLHGFKLHSLTLGLFLSLFLVAFEVSIVSTSLVSITDDLEQFGRSSWVITGYLLTYTSFMVILAKLSDIVGRKMVLLGSLLAFIVFSGLCGASQKMNQLIVFRVLQGIGGSGVYSLVMVVLFEMVPQELFPRYTVLVTALFAISTLCGPLLGGAICQDGNWRWVFLLNVPSGVLALLTLVLCMPTNFPYHGRSTRKHIRDRRKLDLIGAGSMLAGITLLITGFEEASNFAPWTSARVLGPLLISLPAWIGFLATERQVTLSGSDRPEPVFPWRFCASRVVMGVFANSFLSGAVFTSCVIQIPLRFQAVNNESSWYAGIQLIPFGVATAVGGAFAAVIVRNRKLPVVYMFFPGAILQVLGLVFMSRLTLDYIVWKGQYGLQVLTGFGCGISMGAVTLMTPYVIEKRDLATATSAVVQARMLGGALVLAIITAVMNSNLSGALALMLSAEEFARVFRAIKAIQDLPESLKTAVKDMFLKGYNMQLRILVGLAAAEVPAALLMWQKEAVRVA
ncbi:putative multidrug resistance protein fnx1 [Polyplosphaeria fusca]|uniref:Multidrug resistance protein fnx1 n=1 Tax=Polyplosphaeria fusca TaxID=682080 RepID=A0A9P4V3R7_9PLEO|nr:putative multidrug resistance protein fnx1 [Polyplosphaeria fusca]